MKQTDNLKMNLPEESDVVDIEQLNDNFRKLDTEVTGKLSQTGDGSNVVARFTAASTRVNVSSGEKISVLLGRIAKWFNDLGSLAFKSSVAKTDLSSDVQASLGKADKALQIESDPTVSAWAKAATKPSYTATEVGAMPAVSNGSAGQVLTKTSTGQEWADAETSFVVTVTGWSFNSGSLVENATTDKTFADVYNAYISGRRVALRVNDRELPLASASSTVMTFSLALPDAPDTLTTWDAASAVWSADGSLECGDEVLGMVTSAELTTAIQNAIQNTWEASY